MAETKKKIIKFVEHDESKKTDKEISISVNSFDNPDFEEIIGAFRQFLIMIGYSSDFVKKIIRIDSEEMKLLGIENNDLDVYDWEVILSKFRQE